MSIVIKEKSKENTFIYAKELSVGDTCRVVDIMYTGQILLRIHNSFISLSNPNLSWGKDCTLKVEKVECELIIK